MIRKAILLATLLSLVIGLPASAQTILQKAERDQLAFIADNDPDIITATKKARETLPEFLRNAKAPRPNMKGFAIKVAVIDGRNKEFFWVTPFRQDGARFIGNINNTPRIVRHVRNGEEIAFDESLITDWLYLEDGRMKGNFSACALLKKEPREQAEALKKRFGLECNF